MNIVELYEQTPVDRHGGIVVTADRVFVDTPTGKEEYVLKPSGELTLVRSESQVLEVLERIRTRLGA